MYPNLECRADILKMLDELTQARKRILERCAALSQEQLHDPVYAGTWSVLHNLQHLAWAEEWMLAWIGARPGPLPPEERPALAALELEAVRVALDESHAAAITFVKRHDESVLREPCRYGREQEETVGGVLWHLIEHEIHHRAFVLHKLSVLERGPCPPGRGAL